MLEGSYYSLQWELYIFLLVLQPTSNLEYCSFTVHWPLSHTLVPWPLILNSYRSSQFFLIPSLACFQSVNSLVSAGVLKLVMSSWHNLMILNVTFFLTVMQFSAPCHNLQPGGPGYLCLATCPNIIRHGWPYQQLGCLWLASSLMHLSPLTLQNVWLEQVEFVIDTHIIEITKCFNWFQVADSPQALNFHSLLLNLSQLDTSRPAT
jgi:hypothetical protein